MLLGVLLGLSVLARLRPDAAELDSMVVRRARFP